MDANSPSTPSAPSISPGDEVRTAADRDQKTGKMVEVFGRYERVADGKAPDATPRDHAAVRLEDGTLIHLQPPWHPNAVRSAEEQEKYADQEIVAQGILLAECPPPPDGRAFAKVPCLYLDIVITDRRTHDLLRGSGQLE